MILGHRRPIWGGAARAVAVGFSIGNKGYIGTGDIMSKTLKDFWEYDPALNTWTQKADYGGTGRKNAVGFYIGSKGYIGTGWDGMGDSYDKDFWEYDPAGDTWTQKEDFGGGLRFGAVGFSIGSKGYIGTGDRNGNTSNGQTKDFWEYDPYGLFAFTDRTWVTLNTEFTSNTITVSWIDAAAPIFITGGTYSINDGLFTSANGTVYNGDTVKVRLTSSGSYSTTMNATLTIGGVSKTFSVTTKSDPLSDTTPDPFTFTARTNVALNIAVASDPHITVSGIDATTPISVVGGAYSINDGLYTSANGTVNNGDTVKVRLTSSWSYSTMTNATLTIGGVSGTFSVTTQAKVVDFEGTVRSGAVGFSIGTKGYIGTGSVDLVDGGSSNYKDFWEYDIATNTWSQKADFGGAARSGAVGFSIGTKGYIGTGVANSYDGTPNQYNDFWEYDVATNTWTRKDDMGVAPRMGAVAFSIGTMGYVGSGYVYDNTFGVLGWSRTNAFWGYDQEGDYWRKMTDIPLGRPGSCAGFAIGTKGYIGTGIYDGLGHSGNPEKYFWEFDPWGAPDGLWTQKADFGGEARSGAVGFSIDGKGYIGLGSGLSGYPKDFWVYDPASDTWELTTDFGGEARISAVGFSIGNSGYVGTGHVIANVSSLSSMIKSYIGVAAVSTSGSKDFWEYDPAKVASSSYMVSKSSIIALKASSSPSGTWTRKADLGGTDTTPGGGSGAAAGGGGGGCFIATAAWGSYLDPHVLVLRDFRDNYLVTNSPGRVFVGYYYTLSPPVADYISKHEPLRTATRFILTPMVYGVEYPWLVLIFGVIVIGMWGCRKKGILRSSC